MSARQLDGVTRSPAGQPVGEVGARFYESWEVPFRAILRRIPALHHLLGSAPGDGAAGSQEATPNRAVQE